ncbi:MAG: hypothetical protein U1F36_01895 [Planctomycetota bacterium]
MLPENHPRVGEAIVVLQQRLALASPRGEGVEIALTTTGMSALGREIPASQPAVGWLRERFARARVLGVRLAARPDPAALSAFAFGLRQCFPPGAPPLADVWRHSGHGVEPLLATAQSAASAPTEPRPLHSGAPAGMIPAPFAGSHGGGHVPAAASPFPAGMPQMGVAQAQAPSPPVPTIQRASLDAVLQCLARSDRARTMLAAMHQRVDAEYHGAAHLDVSSMLEAVVGELPSVLCARPDAATLQIESVLEALLAQIDGFLLARPDDPGTRMTHMATTLARRRFDGASAPQLAAPAPSPQSAVPPRPAPPPLPVGTVVGSPFDAQERRGVPVTPEEPPRAPEATERNRVLDAFAMPPPTLPSTARGPVLPPPAEMATAASLTPRPQIRDDSFESFLEGVRTNVVSRSQAAATAQTRLEDSSDLLIEELRAMPYPNDLELDGGDPALGEGSLGAALYLLTYSTEGQRIVEAVARALEAILRAPSVGQRRLLARWLRFAREGGPNGTQDEANHRLFDFLQRNGITQMLSARETLDLDQVVQTFPTQFVAFLDGLDLKDPQSEKTFGELCDKVGEDSVIDAARVLIEDGTLLTPHRTEKILKLGGRRAAGIARAYVATGAAWTRALVVNFLRRQQLPRQEAAALSIIQPITTFPSGYLADLCECVARGKSNFKLHGYTSLLLRQYIRDTAENPGDLDRRLYAIRALAHWPTPETIQYLEQLTKEGRLLAPTKESRAVRQAASETLKTIRESNKEQG